MTKPKASTALTLCAAWSRTVALTAMTALIPALALSVPIYGYAAESLTTRLSVDPQDLATLQGRQALDERISAAAAKLCRQFRDTRSVAQRESDAECVRDAIASARMQVTLAVAATQRTAGQGASVATAAATVEQRAGN